jgi:anti-sigma B factor antagonist
MNQAAAPGPVGRKPRVEVGLSVIGPGLAVVEVAGEIDMATVQVLSAALVQAAVWPRPEVLLVDLSQVTYLAGCGLHALLTAHSTAEATNGELRLVSASRAVQRVIELTGLERHFHVYPTRAQAQHEARHQHEHPKTQAQQNTTSSNPRPRRTGQNSS